MKLRHKILGVIAVVIAVAIVSLALAVSHDSPCAAAPALRSGAVAMKAIVHRCYGTAEVLRLEDIEKPTPGDDEFLVKVHAASVNPLDWHYLRGTPYVVRIEAGLGGPDNPRLGVDFAGTVEAVGKNIKRFKPGDEVFGGKYGAFAEYLAVPNERAVVLKPAALTFEQAAAIPIAGITAFQGLRGVKPGQKVLIIGASGGVGTFAVQIARSMGATVTGVCSTRNVELVRSLGADRVIDYTHEDVLADTETYDLILDNVGNRSLTELLSFRRLLTPRGSFVLIGGGGPTAGNWLGPLATAFDAWVISVFVSQKFGMMLADLTAEDLTALGDLMQAGKVQSVIDRRYALADTAAAIRYLEQGHARGKVVINLD